MRCRNGDACQDPSVKKVSHPAGTSTQYDMVFVEFKACIFVERGQPGCPGTHDRALTGKVLHKCKHCLDREIDEQDREWERIAQEQQRIDQERKIANQEKERLEKEKRILDERVTEWLDRVSTPSPMPESFPTTTISIPASSSNVTGSMPAPTMQRPTAIPASSLLSGPSAGYGATVPTARDGTQTAASGGVPLPAAQASKRDRPSSSANSRPSSRASNLSAGSGGSGNSVKIGESALSAGGNRSKPPSSTRKSAPAPATKKTKWDQ